MAELFQKLLVFLRIDAIKRLFSFVEIKRTEVLGLVSFAVAFAILEGAGISLLLPVLQYAESGSSAIEQSSGTVWRVLNAFLSIINIKPNLVVLLILAFLPTLFRNVIFYFKTWYSSIVSSRIMLRLRMKVVRVVYDADPEFYNRHPVGQLVGVVMNQTAAAGNAVLAVINQLGIVFLVLVYVGILLFISVPLTASALFFAVLVALVNKTVLNWIKENAMKSAVLGQELMGKIVERMSQMKLIKMRDTKAQEAGYIEKVSETMRTLSIRAAKVGATVEVIVDPVLMLSVFVTLYIGIAFLGSTLAQLALLIFILTRLNAKIKEFNAGMQQISTAASGVKLVKEMYDAAKAADTIHSGAAEFEGLKESIVFDQVAFSFPVTYTAGGVCISRGKQVLYEINAEIPVGSFTALVGRSGAGKSTMVELIPRMRDVDAGEIRFDGRPIQDFKVGSLRKSIGYVTQTPMLFNDTIYENMCYGLDFVPTEEQIRAALDQAYASFVYDLPEGIHTSLGDRGVLFSGGERRRIALARVLLQDTDILIFDEPTSALDSESEGYIQKTMASLHGKKTIIVIAHRLATVVKADQLFVVDKGRIIESGTHHELLASKGAYAKLFESQLIGLSDGHEA